MTNIRCITPWPGQYFHGFYNIQPWDASGRRFLCHKAPFIDHMPQTDEEVILGLIDLQRQEFQPLASTKAWNYQLGSMAHWVGGELEGWIIFNAREDGRFVSIMLDPRSGRQRRLPSSIFTVSHDGHTALGYDFARIHPIRPGYAYHGVPYPIEQRLAPADEGIVSMDLRSGQARMILSFAELAQRYHIEQMEGVPVMVSRLLFNADDSRIVFSFRFHQPRDKTWYTSLITANPDGSDLCQVFGFHDHVAHFDWCGKDHLLAWARFAGEPAGFHLVHARTRQRQTVGSGILKVDGHCCYSPDSRWILTDTFPNAQDQQELMLFDPAAQRKIELGRFAASPQLRGDLRCDLHPCWNRVGNQLSFDSLHEGRRAVYVVDDLPG